MSLKSELDLFGKRPIQTDIEDINYVYYYPLISPSGNDAPIEFYVPGNMLYYLDLSDTSLGVKVKVTKEDGTNLAEADSVAPANNWLHTLFSDITLVMNDTTIEGGSHLYPYKAYLTNLLLYGHQAKKMQLQTSGWAKDQSGHFNDAVNTGFVTRKSWIRESNVHTLEGPLLLDMFMQNKLLLNQVDLRLRLTRTAPKFNLISLGNPTVNAKVNIDSVYLKMKQVQVAPDRARQIETGLALQNAIYPIQRTEMYTYTIPQGIRSHVRENLFHNRRPKLLILGMVTNEDFNGTYGRNPFRFPHLGLNYIGLYIDGKPIPQIPYQPNFTTHDCVDLYRNLYRAVDMLNGDGDIDITKNDFVNGNTLYTFVLSPDGRTGGAVGQPLVNGNIRIELKFTNALAAPINVLCMAVYDDEVQISRMRTVTVDYMA